MNSDKLELISVRENCPLVPVCVPDRDRDAHQVEAAETMVTSREDASLSMVPMIYRSPFTSTMAQTLPNSIFPRLQMNPDELELINTEKEWFSVPFVMHKNPHPFKSNTSRGKEDLSLVPVNPFTTVSSIDMPVSEREPNTWMAYFNNHPKLCWVTAVQVDADCIAPQSKICQILTQYSLQTSLQLKVSVILSAITHLDDYIICRRICSYLSFIDLQTLVFAFLKLSHSEAVKYSFDYLLSSALQKSDSPI